MNAGEDEPSEADIEMEPLRSAGPRAPPENIFDFDVEPEDAREWVKVGLLVGNYVVQVVISLILIGWCMAMIIREGPSSGSTNVFFGLLGGVTEFWLQKTLEYAHNKATNWIPRRARMRVQRTIDGPPAERIRGDEAV